MKTTKLDNTLFALVLKGDSNTALAVGSSSDVKATLKAGLLPGAWARQATLLESQMCLNLAEYFQPREQVDPDGNAGGQAIGSGDLAFERQQHLNGYSWDTEVRAAYVAPVDEKGLPLQDTSAQDAIDYEAHLLAQKEASYDTAEARGYWGQLYRQFHGRTQAMIGRIKRLSNISVGPDQAK